MNRKLRLLFLLLALMLTGSSFASTLYYVVDDIRYAANTVDNTAQVVSYGSYKSMTEINIPASITADGVSYKVTSLGDSCFKGCTSLTSVKIPASVTALGDSCFNDCTSLESITIPASVTKLGWCCFKGCTGLTSITIPNSVTSLGWYCFGGCTSLTRVYCLGTTPPSCNDYYTFENKASKTLYVPEESVDAYKSAIVWKDFGKILPIGTTGIKAVDMDKIDIAVEDGNLKLCNVPANEPVSVYSTSGELLGSGKGNISVRALSGQAVILKVGTRSRKVLVK